VRGSCGLESAIELSRSAASVKPRADFISCRARKYFASPCWGFAMMAVRKCETACCVRFQRTVEKALRTNMHPSTSTRTRTRHQTSALS
jgi:hypothetical protein